MTKTDTAVMSAKLNEEVIVQMIKEARPTLNAAQKSQPATRSAKFSLADFALRLLPIAQFAPEENLS